MNHSYTVKDCRSSEASVQADTLLYLSRSHLEQLGGGGSALYVQALEEVLALHARKQFVQPLKPYLRMQEEGGHIADRIIAMPAYIGGTEPIAGIKWIGSKHDNPSRLGKERASGVIVLNDPDTHYPVAVMEAGLISSMRTAAVTVAAAKVLAKPDFARIAILGCGLIAERQLQAMLEHFPAIREVVLFDLQAEAASRLADRLFAQFPSVRATLARSAEEAVRRGEVIITCTVADQPYIPYAWLSKGAFVSNISIMDLEKDVFLSADKVVVDDWDQANREKKVLHQLVQEGRFSKEQLHAELGEIIAGQKPGRTSEEEIIVLNPMGMAIEDIACARYLYRKALECGVGDQLPLY
ncbi:2,3-diaminopropionate biosynthesis protein SbnB [Xylanibacillus composti]|uniref:N-[(2S)-2-amino-2-carboxyethyl]-L-glutamate dehydrogenase SbnB n=1 Tax=Xylanibacillus composti TaxID=1572762 RepID=A0A8J4H2P0_9BACL|nr:2,3-diaminopropionate biosynthesis protein SbnB [Xylanibacillus composti]MDT9723958.1 2,3-diaminopropionate biosynthesis protein SbnB [Xylanibacillus composti]GIQ67839.1 N-[(2S)-2-amino-2-carboxyethyl]-L-glutamate dehydrogenase SbnB [Xylanibacillus composti]